MPPLRFTSWPAAAFLTLVVAPVGQAVAASCVNLAGESRGPLAAGVSYDLSAQTLRIVTETSGELIAFDLHSSFIATREALSKARYDEAMLTMAEEVRRACGDQTIAQVEVKDHQLVLRGRLTGPDCKVGYTMTAVATSAHELALSVSFDDPGFNRTTLRYGSSKDEAFFGLGEQFSYFNLKGHVVPVKVEEQGVGRGGPFSAAGKAAKLDPGTQFTTYFPVPQYLTSNHRGFFLDTTAYSLFDFSRDDQVELDVWQAPLHVTLTAAASPLAVLELQTAKTGRFRPLPSWAHGTILGVQGGRAKAEQTVAAAKKAGANVTGLWIQDWVGRRQTSFGSRLWWRWNADESAAGYPHFSAFCRAMKDQGVRVLGYINTFLADVGPMYEEAKAKGYLVKNAKGEDYRLESVGTPMYLLDLTNPATQRWIKGIIKNNMIGSGLSGWMADFGEYLPLDAKLFSGVSAELYHNQYPVDWARMSREAIEESGRDDIVFFSRAGFSGANRYTSVVWEGDQLVNFDADDGLGSAVTALLSGGASGIALSHSDTGGYTTLKGVVQRSGELLERWSEVSAFTPFFRTHEGNRPGDNVQFYTDAASLKAFARMGQLHAALAPYFEDLEQAAATHGTPVVRSLFLHYSSDPDTYHLSHQFLLGEDLLVLPVLAEGASDVTGYFPKGRWQNIWSGALVTGPTTTTVPAPQGLPAAFVRVGGPWSPKLLAAVRKAGL